MVGRSSQDREKATLCWAVLLSVIVHASVFCGAAAPRANRAADSVAATLVMVDRGGGANTAAERCRANANANVGLARQCGDQPG